MAAGITVALLWLLWRQLEPGTLVSLLREVSPIWVAIGTCLYLALNVLRAGRYGILMPGHRLGTRDLLPLSLGVSLLGNALPARAGEVSFVWLARSGHGVRAADAVAAVAVARLLDLVAVALWFVPLAALTLPQLPERTDWPVSGLPTRGVIALVAASVVAGALLVAALAARGGRAVAALHRVADRRRWAGRRRVDAFLGFADEAARALEAVRDRRVLGPAVVLSLACWAVTFAWLYAFARGLGQHTGFAVFVVGVTFAVLSKAVPTPTLGGHGASEAGWSVGFALVGQPPAAAVATGLAVSVLNMAVVAGFGLPALAWMRRRQETP